MVEPHGGDASTLSQQACLAVLDLLLSVPVVRAALRHLLGGGEGYGGGLSARSSGSRCALHSSPATQRLTPESVLRA